MKKCGIARLCSDAEQGNGIHEITDKGTAWVCRNGETTHCL